ncbi:MAG: Fic family protein [Deltaproteobacteria bacterium]|nr:Fic family protein [Deltaproteobacteria bacterium]
MRCIHQRPGWPNFTWDQEKLSGLLASVRHRQGKLLGRMEALGFNLQTEASLNILTLDVLKSSEIEGEILNPDQIRSSIARRLGLDIAGLVPADRHVDGVVEMMLNATQNFSEALAKKRLWGWHAALFPTGFSGMHKITVGAWRGDERGPMQVVSGPMGRERVHFEAPEASRLDAEMARFLAWFNRKIPIDDVVKAAVAHLWFVTIHPFDDGNGRIARAIADMQLARSEGSRRRFYSLSAQIRQERRAYYDMLEKTQKGGLDITMWLAWFLNCLDHALAETENTLKSTLNKAQFWESHRATPLNARQQIMLNRLLDGFVGRLTSSKWAKITKCSQDTALRDIQDLLDRKILVKDLGGGRSTGYLLKQ